MWILLSVACGLGSQYYPRIEASLQKDNPEQAARIVAEAEEEYGVQSRLLYLMDQGMTLHLAGHYHESNDVLEQADILIDDLYTRRLRNQASAFLINDLQLPFRGEPYEQVMVNVIKALNYAVLGDFEGALVEARRLDHRLNVLTDSVDPEEYHEDPFARYLTGILYESAGDLPNALIAYQKAYEAYEEALPWLGLLPPPLLGQDLLRVSQALHLEEEYAVYRRAFPDVPVPKAAGDHQLAQLVVISYHGQAPELEDVLLDVPISLEALNLVAATETVRHRHSRRTRGGEALLYGIHGHIVRVALPRLVPHKSHVAYALLRAKGINGVHEGKTQLVYNVTATAKKNLDDRYPSLTVKAVARAAAKMAAAEGIGIGAASATNKKSQGTIRAIVSSIARIFAIASEESDKRSWRTLPDEIHIGRFWLPAGTYTLRFQSVDHDGRTLDAQSQSAVTLQPERVHLITKRIVF